MERWMTVWKIALLFRLSRLSSSSVNKVIGDKSTFVICSLCSLYSYLYIWRHRSTAQLIVSIHFRTIRKSVGNLLKLGWVVQHVTVIRHQVRFDFCQSYSAAAWQCSLIKVWLQRAALLYSGMKNAILTKMNADLILVITCTPESLLLVKSDEVLMCAAVTWLL